MSGLMDFMFGGVIGGSVLFATSGHSNLHVPKNGGDAPATESQLQT
jgi:hypothetical protein